MEIIVEEVWGNTSLNDATELMNQLYKASGFIPSIGDEILIEGKSDLAGLGESDCTTVMVCGRAIQYDENSKEFSLVLWVTNDNVTPALITHDKETLRGGEKPPKYFFKA